MPPPPASRVKFNERDYWLQYLISPDVIHLSPRTFASGYHPDKVGVKQAAGGAILFNCFTRNPLLVKKKKKKLHIHKIDALVHMQTNIRLHWKHYPLYEISQIFVPNMYSPLKPVHNLTNDKYSHLADHCFQITMYPSNAPSQKGQV